MNEAIAQIVTQKLVDTYERKISNVLSTSPEYSVYCKLVADLSIMGVNYTTRVAEARIVSGQESKRVQKLYTQFLINCTRCASQSGA